MSLQICRFLTLLLSGLGMTMGAAHILELGPKMAYGPELYSTVNTTLYRNFGAAGAVLTIASIVSAGILAYLVRGRPSFPLTFAGALTLLLSFGLWLVLVAPVNSQIAAALRSTPEMVPELWMLLRRRWEYGHVVAAGVWTAGFILLLLSVLREIPAAQTEVQTAPAAARTRARA